MSDDFPLLGFDIGGTKAAVCLGTASGRMLGARRIPTGPRDPQQVVPEMIAAGRALLAEADGNVGDLRAVGIGAPGPLDVAAGVMLPSPNMKAWDNIPIRDLLGKEFGVEAFFDNDANAGALAEWMFGSGQGCRDMLYLTMSTGIGGGIIANGRLVRGRSGGAGELGHVVLDLNGPVCNCGLRGCYEAFCGGRALAQRMQRELAGQTAHPVVEMAGGNLADVDLVALEKAVRVGDGYAIALWGEMCRRNAQAIGMFINIFNPEKVVLGTLAWAAGDLFMKPVLEQLPAYCWPEFLRDCEVLPSALKRHIGERSGICVALYGLLLEGRWRLPWEG
jgi:glucokinase